MEVQEKSPVMLINKKFPVGDGNYIMVYLNDPKKGLAFDSNDNLIGIYVDFSVVEDI